MIQKKLFTPGPLCTSDDVKNAMTRDVGSRTPEMGDILQDVRDRLYALADVDALDYGLALVPGSGTYGLESVLSSVTKPDDEWLVLVNGSYAIRLADILDAQGLIGKRLEFPHTENIGLKTVEEILQFEKSITHIAMVHCETSTGMINNIQVVGQLAKKYNKHFFVDAMSSFGGVPISFQDANIDYLVTSANKCLESVPGLSVVFAKRDLLAASEGNARTYSLNLHAHLDSQENKHQFLFTPPVQVLLAFQAAVKACQNEGIEHRAMRYQKNYLTLIESMAPLGCFTILEPEFHSHIITSFEYPDVIDFDFNAFYMALYEKNHVIYPGKLDNYFRIGTIGNITPNDIVKLVDDIKLYLSRYS